MLQPIQSILQGLNAAQKEAVTSSAPIVQILAPPGSGKTKTLTSRVAHLIACQGYAPWNVICCTFTIKASREMRDRLRGLIGEEVESKLILGTFHSICRRYLVKYGHLIGIPKNFGIADSNDSLSIIRRIKKNLGLNFDESKARGDISHRKARGLRIEDLTAAAAKKPKKPETQEFLTIFREYENALTASSLLDYDDLLLHCADLLREHPACVSNIEALLIDEFQDTNVIQFELMKLFASAKKRITIVGDPDQSIYGFRSAEIENLLRMRAYYPETIVINLEENYRSASAVLQLAQEVIEQDTNRPNKKLRATHCHGTLPVLRRLHNSNEEALWIVSEVKRMCRMTGELISHSDIAVLLRSAFLSRLIETALASAGIPYRMVGGKRFFDRPEVRLMIDYLRTISHPDNDSALVSIINDPPRKVGDVTIESIRRAANRKNISLWNAIQQACKGQLPLERKLTSPAQQGLKELVSIVERARQKVGSVPAEEVPSRLLAFVISCLDLKAHLKSKYPEEHEERWDYVGELVTQASDTSSLSTLLEERLVETDDGDRAPLTQSGEDVLAAFLVNVALSTEVQEAEESVEKPRVTISTIHSAKGLEWPVVFIPAVYEGSIPHSRANDTDEERRLLYVAMTRAKVLLYMTFPLEQTRDKSESVLTPFLPPKVHRFTAKIGPVMSASVLRDLGAILGRDVPPQEEIARARSAMKENESSHDDVWPSDGSRRRNHAPSDLALVGQTARPVPSQDGVGRQPGSRTEYYSLANHQTTMNNMSGYSTANMTMGITTAKSQHMTNLERCGADDNADQRPKPVTSKQPRKDKMANQSTVSSFFARTPSQGYLGPNTNGGIQVPTLARSNSGSAPSSGRQGQPPVPEKKAPSIPPQLARHKLSLGVSGVRTRLPLPLPLVLDTAKSAETQQLPKRPYAFLSSSPTREDYETVKTNKLDDGESSPTICGLEQNAATSYGMNIPTTSTSTSTSTSFRASALTGLDRLNKAPPLSKKTLGVRRSMNGWADRKNR